MGKKGVLVYGVGVNDYEGKTKDKGKVVKSYTVWASMLCRCYNKKYNGIGVADKNKLLELKV